MFFLNHFGHLYLWVEWQCIEFFFSLHENYWLTFIYYLYGAPVLHSLRGSFILAMIFATVQLCYKDVAVLARQ